MGRGKTDEQQQSLVDQRLIKAMGHPLRMRLLMRFNERVASPNELAKEFDEPLGNVAYHTRMLLELGCLELARTVPRRGATEHFYRAVVRPFFSDEDWAALPQSARQSISDTVLQRAWSDAADALHAGTLDLRDDRHLSRTHLVLDEPGWEELNALLAGVLEQAFEIQAESAARRTAADAAPEDHEVLSSLIMMHFTRPKSTSSTTEGSARREREQKPRRRRNS
jgi:Helix-turn-helix domain